MPLNIHPRLLPDALWALSSMGHGGEVIVADASFPRKAVAPQGTFGRLVRMDCESVGALEAVSSVMPIDTFIDDAAGRMEVVGSPDEIPEVQARALPLLLRHTRQVVGIERFAF
jgi:L-fucose mutarotase